MVCLSVGIEVNNLIGSGTYAVGREDECDVEEAAQRGIFILDQFISTTFSVIL